LPQDVRLTEGLALSLGKARGPSKECCISAAFSCRVFGLGRRDGAKSNLDRENELLPTSNEAKRSLELEPTLPLLREAPTPRRYMN
jgi:hypothetical protein